MRILFLVLLLFIKVNIVLAQNSNSLLIEKKQETFANQKGCLATSFYPYISIQNLSSSASSLNSYLRDVNSIKKMAAKCFSSDTTTVNIVGDYATLLQSDSLICFEYCVSSSAFDKMYYRSVFVDPVNLELVEPLDYINTKALVPWIKKYVDSNKVSVNMSVYESNNWKSLCYGLTPDEFVLYIGGEGEFYGNYKILIPLEEVFK